MKEKGKHQRWAQQNKDNRQHAREEFHEDIVQDLSQPILGFRCLSRIRRRATRTLHVGTIEQLQGPVAFSIMTRPYVAGRNKEVLHP